MNNDREIAHTLALLDNRVSNAKTVTDLTNALMAARLNPTTLSYTHQRLFIQIAALLSASAIGLTVNSLILEASSAVITYLSIGSLLVVIFGCRTLYKREQHAKNIAMRVYIAASRFELELDNNPKSEFGVSLLSRFSGLNLGNYCNEFREFMTYKGGRTEHGFSYFKYVATSRTQSESSENKDKWIYKHTIRCGIITQFTGITKLKIMATSFNDKFEHVNTIDNFDSLFKVEEHDMGSAAKFLTADNKELLLALRNCYRAISLEFDDQSMMCISFDDVDLLEVGKPQSISRPDLIINDIEQPDQFSKFRRLVKVTKALR